MSKLKIPITDRDHVRGAKDAALVLVEYGDYQCPFCAAAEARLRLVERALPGDIQRVYRHFPLTQAHEYAFPAAVSAEAAGVQGSFWEMHETLFENQANLGPGSFETFAVELGLDLDAFREAFTSDAVQNRIKEDFRGGVRSGVNGTPSVYLNGVKYEGPLDPDVLIRLMKAA